MRALTAMGWNQFDGVNGPSVAAYRRDGLLAVTQPDAVQFGSAHETVTQAFLTAEIERVEKQERRKLLHVEEHSDVTLREWLDQFETLDEQWLALRLFEAYELISQGDLQKKLRALHAWLETQPGFDMEKTHLTHFGVAKSGAMIQYYYRHANHLPTETNIEYDHIGRPAVLSTGKAVDTLVILDDFIGTGREADWYLKLKRAELGRYEHVYFLTVVGYDEGLEMLKERHPNVTVHALERHHKLFSDAYTGFNPDEKTRLHALIRKYGSHLYPRENLPERSTSTHNVMSPFGYRNGQAMVGFFYNTPSNATPLLWSKENGWKPILYRCDAYDFFNPAAYSKR